MRLVHLTDPHLSSLAGHRLWTLAGKRRLGYLSWTQVRRRHHRREVLEILDACVRREAPDAIAVTGDLVQLGLADEIAQAAVWLRGLDAAAVLLVPGNHDVYQGDAYSRVRDQWRDFLHLPAMPAADFPTRLDCGDLTLIGLSSARPSPFWSAAGRIGAAQLERLDAVLAASAGRLRCVLVHHPPLPGQCGRRKGLADAAALSSVIARHGVELVLHGHLHRNASVSLDGRTRVLATASASNASLDGRASYRVLDVAAEPDAWRVGARLKTLDEHGAAVVRETAEWSFARPR